MLIVFCVCKCFSFWFLFAGARRLYANLSTSPGTREGPLLHVPFLSCDLPASLEDIESQCQVMSICQDVFSSVQCCRGFQLQFLAFWNINEHDGHYFV